jgi:3-methylcrotonyl-CoA carboxylase alpha subunit
LAWLEPQGVRMETGFGAGDEVSRYYDSLLAKVIVHASTRDEAIQRLHDALMDFHVLGIKTNIGFLLDVIRHPGFKSGQFDTGFIEKWMKNRAPSEPSSQVERDLAVLIVILDEMDKRKVPAEFADTDDTRSASLWKTTGRRESLRQ